MFQRTFTKEYSLPIVYPREVPFLSRLWGKNTKEFNDLYSHLVQIDFEAESDRPENSFIVT